jgi:phosphoribosylformylglycinamidine synthase
MMWNGETIVDVSREFLNSNGAEKHIDIAPAAPEKSAKPIPAAFAQGMRGIAGDLNICSRRGLSERFDSTIGAGTVLMPFGGRNQLTPIQAMVNKISVENAHTDDASFMAWGYNPFISEKSPYHGAYLAVVESISKLIATGASYEDVYLTFQEYFEKPGRDARRWGKPLAALLGAFRAQLDYSAAAIGGKDSMSGSFEDIDVPPTLVSFAVTTGKTADVISPEFKAAGHEVVWLKPEYDTDGVPVPVSETALYARVNDLMRRGIVAAAYTPTYGGAAEAVMKMAFGNDVGINIDESITLDELFGYSYGSFILELTESIADAKLLGVTTADAAISYRGEAVSLPELLNIYEGKLEPIYACNIPMEAKDIPAFSYTASEYPAPAIKTARPRVLIPVFPGTNCEYDAAKQFRAADAEPELFVINNLSSAGIADSVTKFAEMVKNSQIIFIPGGFSGGDEPDGSAKFITAFFRNARIRESVAELLNSRDGLMAGICNGFQALVKLGLLPYGEIRDTTATDPTLTYNVIARHQSRIVRTRVASNKSPWLMATAPGEVYTVPISHGEGRFLAGDDIIAALAANGQIATQYVDFDGAPTYDIRHNPNGSAYAIEGICSPDGRVFGKMGHSERWDAGLYRNVAGAYDMGMFASAVKYFK